MCGRLLANQLIKKKIMDVTDWLHNINQGLWYKNELGYSINSLQSKGVNVSQSCGSNHFGHVKC